MIKRKILSLALVSVLTASIVAGCAQQTANNAGANTQANVEASAETSVEGTIETSTAAEEASTEAATEATSAEAVVEENAPSVTVKGITERSDEMRDISAKELVAEMTAGWNLGNTLEATGGDGLSSETSWGNPKITKEMIDTVCEKGFDSIRIPITWGNHVGDAPDYEIDPAWMDRIEEVVNYALDDGMYVLIDSHHEEFWRIPDAEHIDAVDAENIAIWKQVAERFKDYGDHLVFEGLNEPRTKGSDGEWSGGTHDERVYVNQLNKSFVDTVRATGGNNEKRLLLVTTYADSPLVEVINDLEIPEDEHIAVAIHAYEPYAFTFENGEDWEIFDWNGSHNKDINTLMINLNKYFRAKDIPVLITEYGAMNKKENAEEVEKWASYYVSKATEKGIPCFWWDNGIYNQSGEKFAILDRKNLTWYRENVVDAIIEASYAGKE